MNNLNNRNMKRTIFEGVVNGEKFDNINDYNTRVKELMDSGKFESASSSTRVEEYETSGFQRVCNDLPSGTTTCTEIPTYCGKTSTTGETVSAVYDNELSMYPFVENDFSLNILNNHITENMETNKEVIKKIEQVLNKCFPYIMDTLTDSTVDIVEKREYVNDVEVIIDCLAEFKNYANTVIGVIAEKQDKLNKEYTDKIEELSNEYDKKCEELDNKLNVLKDGNSVINKLIEFYRDVQSSAFIVLKNVTANSENTCKCEDGKCKCGNCNCKCEGGKCKCENGCKCEDDDQLTKIVTSFVEKIPQGDPMPLTDLVNRIFGDTFTK